MGFEKEFLRWMLSNGAAGFLISDKKNENGLSLRVEWMDICTLYDEERKGLNLSKGAAFLVLEKETDGAGKKKYMQHSVDNSMPMMRSMVMHYQTMVKAHTA